MAFALGVLNDRAPSPALVKAHDALVQYVFDSAVPGPQGGLSLNEYTGLRWGTAGIGLFLLQAASRSPPPPNAAALTALAAAAGDFLVSTAVPSNGGLKWMSGFQGVGDVPNYAEGTSGIAYFLLALGNATRNATVAATALAGGTYLEAVANVSGGRCIIFHDSNTPGLYYLANCHGPPGTGRFFLRATELSGNATWARFARDGANALEQLAPLPPAAASASAAALTAAPPLKYTWYVDYDAPAPPWNNVGLCDGSAAAVEYFLTLYRLYGLASDLEFARAVADDVLSRATPVVPGEQLSWTTTEWRTDPARTTGPQVGYMQGAAGMGSMFLWLDAAISGKPSPHIVLPDDYFQSW